jgi:putative flippase GtrA
MRATIKRLLSADQQTGRQGIRYLLVGGFNTAFAYCVSVGLYYALTRRLHIVAIGAIANVICITEAFIAYKIVVFRSHGRWLREYLRCYVVYGGNALIGIGGLWLLANVIGVPFWIAQGGLMIVGIAISYVGHDRFTFDKAQRG